MNRLSPQVCRPGGAPLPTLKQWRTIADPSKQSIAKLTSDTSEAKIDPEKIRDIAKSFLNPNETLLALAAVVVELAERGKVTLMTSMLMHLDEMNTRYHSESKFKANSKTLLSLGLIVANDKYLKAETGYPFSSWETFSMQAHFLMSLDRPDLLPRLLRFHNEFGWPIVCQPMSIYEAAVASIALGEHDYQTRAWSYKELNRLFAGSSRRISEKPAADAMRSLCKYFNHRLDLPVSCLRELHKRDPKLFRVVCRVDEALRIRGQFAEGFEDGVDLTVEFINMRGRNGNIAAKTVIEDLIQNGRVDLAASVLGKVPNGIRRKIAQKNGESLTDNSTVLITGALLVDSGDCAGEQVLPAVYSSIYEAFRSKGVMPDVGFLKKSVDRFIRENFPPKDSDSLMGTLDRCIERHDLRMIDRLITRHLGPDAPL